ncbi:hypothetical protein TNCV_1264551, partial [Trichonephila clavipes]
MNFVVWILTPSGGGGISHNEQSRVKEEFVRPLLISSPSFENVMPLSDDDDDD